MQPIVSKIRLKAKANNRKNFDYLEPLGLVDCSVIEPRQIPEIFALATAKIPDLVSSVGAVEKVLKHNRDSVLVFSRNGRACGFYAMLHLTEQGHDELIKGDLDLTDLGPTRIAATGERPFAIYTWATVATHRAIDGFGHTSVFLRQQQYARANLFARPATPDGARFMRRIGYRPMTNAVEDLHRYVREINRQ